MCTTFDYPLKDSWKLQVTKGLKQGADLYERKIGELHFPQICSLHSLQNDIAAACDGGPAVAACINGLCGQGYFCNARGFCCRCQSGNTSGSFMLPYDQFLDFIWPFQLFPAIFSLLFLNYPLLSSTKFNTDVASEALLQLSINLDCKLQIQMRSWIFEVRNRSYEIISFPMCERKMLFFFRSLHQWSMSSWLCLQYQ